MRRIVTIALSSVFALTLAMSPALADGHGGMKAEKAMDKAEKTMEKAGEKAEKAMEKGQDAKAEKTMDKAAEKAGKAMEKGGK